MDLTGVPPYTGVAPLSSIRLYCFGALRFCDPHSFFSACRKERMRLAGVRKKRRCGGCRRRRLRIVRFLAGSKAHSLRRSSSPMPTRFAGLVMGPIRRPPHPLLNGYVAKSYRRTAGQLSVWVSGQVRRLRWVGNDPLVLMLNGIRQRSASECRKTTYR